MFANDDARAEQLEALGRRTGDRVWRLPYTMAEDFAEPERLR